MPSEYTLDEVAAAQSALDSQPSFSPFWERADDELEIIQTLNLVPRSTESQRRRYHNAIMRGARDESLTTNCEHQSEMTPDGHGSYCVHCGETLS